MKELLVLIVSVILFNALPIKAQIDNSVTPITTAESTLARNGTAEANPAYDDVLSLSELQRIQEKNKAMSLDHFYIVRTSFSDMAPHFFHYILDVRPTNEGTLVRLIRIAGLDPPCDQVITVKAVQKLLPGMTPLKLVGKNNPCALSMHQIQWNIREPKTRESIFESLRFGIVASCGSDEMVIDLPYVQNVDFEFLKKEEPQVAALWDLDYQLTKSVFGEASLFYGISEERDSELQRFAESLIPELLSGQYDKGFFCGMGIKSSDCGNHPTQAVLSGYQPNARVPEQMARLINAEQFHFIKYVIPPYPRLAQLSRIESKVDLELSVDSKTGKVLRATVTKGHPLLDKIAVDAALQWQFDPLAQKLDQPVKLALEFARQCP
jgi:TonB family protein